MLFIYYGFYDIGWTPLPCKLFGESKLVLRLTVSSLIRLGDLALSYEVERTQYSAIHAEYSSDICK